MRNKSNLDEKDWIQQEKRSCWCWPMSDGRNLLGSTVYFSSDWNQLDRASKVHGQYMIGLERGGHGRSSCLVLFHRSSSSSSCSWWWPWMPFLVQILTMISLSIRKGFLLPSCHKQTLVLQEDLVATGVVQQQPTTTPKIAGWGWWRS